TSVPSAFVGVLLLKAIGTQRVENFLTYAIGVALLASAIAMVAQTRLNASRQASTEPVRVKPLPTLAIGALGGLLVGMTSVGSGSLIIVLLLIVYPRLVTAQLVGTDLVQAIPLVGSAAFGHLLFGDVKLGLTLALLLGAIPGVLLGALISSRTS